MASRSSHRTALATLVLAVVVGLAPLAANARVGGGSSFGSRGSKTFTAPPATATAPRTAAPFERSETARSFPSSAANAARPGFFGGGFGRGLLGGLVGAGLVGMLFGHGMFGGLGDMMSILGLVVQLALLFFVVRFAINWFRNRQQPAVIGAPRTGLGGGFGGAAPGGAGAAGLGAGFGAAGAGGFAGAAPQQPVRPLAVTGADYAGFEQTLVAVQSAYSAEDFTRLDALATPEMAANFTKEIADNGRKGVVNRIADVKFLQGDLAEAWSEGADDYATVAMRFSLIDTMVDRATQRVVSGDPRPAEVTEVWTFRRSAADPRWKVSAIQQA